MQPASKRLRPPARAVAAALGVAFVATMAEAAPPAPRPGMEYRLVLRQGPEARDIEIRHRGTRYRHELLGEERAAVILYETETSAATVIDGDAVFTLTIPPTELGGFDAPAMMAGLADGPVTWTPGPGRRIAGADCTEHTGTGRKDGAAVFGRYCVTDDGIVLAITTGGAGQVGRALEAVAFEIAPQPPDLFEAPAAPPN
jgi:hypothetical protein